MKKMFAPRSAVVIHLNMRKPVLFCTSALYACDYVRLFNEKSNDVGSLVLDHANFGLKI